MEPKLPTPHFQPEQAPMLRGQTPERSPESLPEVFPESSNEVVEQRTVQNTPTPALPPVSIPLPPSPVSGAPTDNATPAADTPLVAADEDLIEKEWVDKAKKIVEATKDDPYQREQEVGKLQADYLRKRYGKELGASQ